MSTCPRCHDKPIRPISLDGSAVYEQRRANRNQSRLEEARVHPGLSGARRAYDADRFRTLIQRFALIGKVGLDLRAGKLDEQMAVFRSILNVIQGAPVMVSVHSAGCTSGVVRIVAENPHPGTILHWFLGTADEIQTAARLGCYFSVNSAMPNATLRLIPRDLVLPETDYTSTAGWAVSVELTQRFTQPCPAVTKIRPPFG